MAEHNFKEPSDASGLGRGRKLFSFGRGRPVADSEYEHDIHHSVIPTSDPVASSTPIVNTQTRPTQVISTEAFSSMITDLAKEIGENVAASLAAIGLPSPPTQRTAGSQSGPADPSQLKIVVQSETKAPPYFSGDGTDAFCIQEWEDMMKCCLSRSNCETHAERFDLTMSRLSGKARDIVRVSLHCRPELGDADLPAAVFDILRCNFSKLAYSSLPMKDFYNTLPQPGECAMDYWIRLNKSIDAANECLRRRGKLVEDAGAEVAMMFVTHCPDPNLFLTFQLKPPEEWTAAEVQRRLDNHVGQSRGLMVQSQQTMSIVCSAQTQIIPTCQYTRDCPVAVGGPVDHFSSPSGPVSDQGQVQPVVGQQSHLWPSTPVMQTSCATPAPSAAEHATQQLVGVFDRVLSLCTSSVGSDLRVCERFDRSQGRRGWQHAACRVCKSAEHTTHAHCKLFRLCLTCFKSGHVKRDCPLVAQQSPRPVSPPSEADLN
ncbi:uncharacterized protein LOC143517762 [Brachyhypopomus gauderio]|uniref:uncharacterized protein LOC143517762 n=1 Tax=Brachyhypopomus gauderio TaxID=698409 RepID=UPI004042B2DF